MSSRVLVVEDQAGLLRGIVRGLEQLEGLEVVGCATAEDALEAAAEQAPDLLLTDINLPGRSGLELLAQLDARGSRAPVILITAYRSAYRDQIEARPGIDVLEKPVALDELQRRVLEKLKAVGSQGVSRAFSVADYLQMALLGGNSVLLKVRCDDSQQGSIEIVNGEVWSARLGSAAGEEALAAMVLSPCHEVSATTVDKQPIERKIFVQTERLLLDIARRQDEERRESSGDPGAAPKDEARVDDGYEDALKRGIKAGLKGDLEQAVAALEEALDLRPGDERATFNLQRIRKQMQS